MQIKEMFLKPIKRELNGVIKVGRGSSYQELEEYVVTDDIENYMLRFFKAYEHSYHSTTDKMGVWISGFFGSGKSHLLKILSYILGNVSVTDDDGRTYRAADFFVKGEKVPSKELRALIEKVASYSENTDVILFNVDSKSSTDSKQNKDAIKDVFMKVFNDHLGYCGSIPFLADFERKIDMDGRFDEFKIKFEEINGSSWVDSREDFYFIQDDIIQTVTELGIMSESEAKNWADHAQDSYSLSIDQFATYVKKYCERKGPDHHVAFLVDEIGQYIATDSKLMLNLQTVTEDLGIACGGKAWIIVTAQQDIDSITKVMGDDFSKIQGRFDTRISLSSANVDEVIRKRILAKQDSARPVLAALFKEQETSIKNIITFSSGTPYMPLYEDTEDFINVYPFVPYQFNLLGTVLTSVRQYSSSGKHLADGERSMLALYKEAAVDYSDNTDGVLIPFNAFYGALDDFIDPLYKNVIINAKKNPRLEPFDEELLKVLYMTKHVNTFKRNVENLTTLMISSVDEDRIDLSKKVEKSLRLLCDESYVQKNGDDYIFLTCEEQDVENRIRKIHIDPKDVVTYIASVAFEEVAVFPNNKYKYDSRYQFPFNQFVDDRPVRNTPNANIGLHLLTAYSGQKDDSALGLKAFTEKSVVVRLSDDYPYLQEAEEMKKIETFLNDPSATSLSNYEIISANKRKERAERAKRVSDYVKFAMENADIYVQSTKIATKSKDVVARISEAFKKLIDSRYHKLHAMKSQPSTEDILEILKKTQNSLLNTGDKDDQDYEALMELIEKIRYAGTQGMQYSVKQSLDDFNKDPYGYNDEDVEFLIAKLYRKGQISLKMNSVVYTPASSTPDEIFRYITKKEYREKVLLEIKAFPPAPHVKALKDVIKEFFEKTITSDDPDALMRDFRSYAEVKRTNLTDELKDNYGIDSKMPGKSVIEKAIRLIDETMKLTDPISFYKCVFDLSDDFLDLSDDLNDLSKFLTGPQKDKFLHAVRTLSIYDDSKNFITDQEIHKCAGEVKKILDMEKPYNGNGIPRLEEYDKKLLDAITALLDNATKQFEPMVYTDWKIVKESIPSDRPYKERVLNKINARFQGLIDKLNSCNSVAAINAIPTESAALQANCLSEIQKEENEYQKVIKEKPPVEGVTPPTPAPAIKKSKTLSFRNLTNSKIYSIQTEADVDAVVEEIRQELKAQLEADTIIKLS